MVMVKYEEYERGLPPREFVDSIESRRGNIRTDGKEEERRRKGRDRKREGIREGIRDWRATVLRATR